MNVYYLQLKIQYILTIQMGKIYFDWKICFIYENMYKLLNTIHTELLRFIA